jgi:hypothetical protein
MALCSYWYRQLYLYTSLCIFCCNKKIEFDMFAGTCYTNYSLFMESFLILRCCSVKFYIRKNYVFMYLDVVKLSFRILLTYLLFFQLSEGRQIIFSRWDKVCRFLLRERVRKHFTPNRSQHRTHFSSIERSCGESNQRNQWGASDRGAHRYDIRVFLWCLVSFLNSLRVLGVFSLFLAF